MIDPIERRIAFFFYRVLFPSFRGSHESLYPFWIKILHFYEYYYWYVYICAQIEIDGKEDKNEDRRIEREII